MYQEASCWIFLLASVRAAPSNFCLMRISVDLFFGLAFFLFSLRVSSFNVGAFSLMLSEADLLYFSKEKKKKLCLIVSHVFFMTELYYTACMTIVT